MDSIFCLRSQIDKHILLEKNSQETSGWESEPAETVYYNQNGRRLKQSEHEELIRRLVNYRAQKIKPTTQAYATVEVTALGIDDCTILRQSEYV